MTGARKLGRLTNAEVIHSYHIILRWAVSEKASKACGVVERTSLLNPRLRAAKIMIFRIIMVSDWYPNLKQTKQVHVSNCDKKSDPLEATTQLYHLGPEWENDGKTTLHETNIAPQNMPSLKLKQTSILAIHFQV